MGITKSKDLAEKFGKDWVIQSFLPKVTENYNIDKQGYNYRMCSLNSLKVIIPHIPKDQVSQHVVPLLVKALKDPIPNVRFTSAKVIHKQKQHIDASVFNSQIQNSLKELLQDSDKDVVYFATVALQ